MPSENLEPQDDFDNEVEPSTRQGSTGRWTREEHNAFLRGLELHGKGWKKIASLIKTRTVVQIRTHAQKYFLKLQKSRQNGGASNSVIMDGKPGYKRKRRRQSDQPIALAPSLQPFMMSIVSSSAVEMGRSAPSGANYEDADNGIYNFLSPPLASSGGAKEQGSDTGIGSATGATTCATSDIFGDQSDSSTASGGHTTSEPGSSGESDNGILMATTLGGERARSGSETGAVQKKSDSSKIPEWYKRGKAIESLLKDAENLDWAKDAGAAVAPQNLHRPLPLTQQQRERMMQRQLQLQPLSGHGAHDERQSREHSKGAGAAAGGLIGPGPFVGHEYTGAGHFPPEGFPGGMGDGLAMDTAWSPVPKGSATWGNGCPPSGADQLDMAVAEDEFEYFFGSGESVHDA